MISNIRHTVGNGDILKTATTGKSTISNTFYLIAKSYTSDISTIGKSMISNIRHTVGNNDICKTATTGKGSRRNTGNPFRNDKIRNFFTIKI